MIILTLRTDQPEAEVGLYNDTTKLKYETWTAHRELSTTLLRKIEQLLAAQERTFADVEGVVCYKGPGSFTGLRIGLTVADSFAYSLTVPIVSTTGDDWIMTGIARLLQGENEGVALPHYGAPVHITQQRK